MPASLSISLARISASFQCAGHLLIDSPLTSAHNHPFEKRIWAELLAEIPQISQCNSNNSSVGMKFPQFSERIKKFVTYNWPQLGHPFQQVAMISYRLLSAKNYLSGGEEYISFELSRIGSKAQRWKSLSEILEAGERRNHFLFEPAEKIASEIH
ncbi:MAG TPA: hypothetical protein VED17_09965 [Nitrososphaerales archaeon]|nr:hypothetical protein [Nitrososphaerales archaeon]